MLAHFLAVTGWCGYALLPASPQVRVSLEELDSDGGLFTAARIAQLQGEHDRCRRAAEGPAGARYVLLVDVAGEEETDPGPESFDAGSKRDSTALTVVRLGEEIGGKLQYEVVDRMRWTGRRHTELHAQIVDLAAVVDATGIGAGLASFLAGALRSSRVHVHPFLFTAASKSTLAWDLLGLMLAEESPVSSGSPPGCRSGSSSRAIRRSRPGG